MFSFVLDFLREPLLSVILSEESTFESFTGFSIPKDYTILRILSRDRRLSDVYSRTSNFYSLSIFLSYLFISFSFSNSPSHLLNGAMSSLVIWNFLPIPLMNSSSYY